MIDLSIFSSTIRPENWMIQRESFGNPSMEYEVVFVGPKQPDYKLPDNYRFIQSNVKPTQCIEIAARNCVGNVVMHISDDMRLNGEKPLDKLYNEFLEYNNKRLILSCLLMINNTNLTDAQIFFVDQPSSPPMPLCGMMFKETYMELGGIDRRFIGADWDLDIAMRLLSTGGEVKFSSVFAEELTCWSSGISLYSQTAAHDRYLLDRLWSVNRKISFNRSLPFEPFDDKDILTISQGEKGRWQ